MKRTLLLFPLFVTVSLSLAALQIAVPAQSPGDGQKLSGESKRARDYSLRMLDEMKEILEANYFDPKFHSMDLKARIETAKTRVNTLQYNWQMYRVLAQVLMDLDDSHTRMLMPPRTDHFEYGLTWQMIGNLCFVTSIKKESDAAAQGVEVGDQIVKIGKYPPARNNLWKINYLLYRLDPVNTLDLSIRKPDGTEKSLTIKAKTSTDKEWAAEQKAKKEKRDKDKEKYAPFRCHEISKELTACKLDSFIVEKGDIDKMMRQASQYPNLILDLRGNPGGYVAMEQYLLSFFFDREIKIADLVYKDKKEVRVTKVLDADKRYKGQVIVLVDSNSASAAEMTARVLQIEKRARVFGDYSSGSVMTSVVFPFTSIMSALSDAAVIKIGMSVTIADVVMRDGSRLEHIGVVPDEVLQPVGLALKLKADAVLAYTASKFGANLSPEDAGKFYFITEKDEDDDEPPGVN